MYLGVRIVCWDGRLSGDSIDSDYVGEHTIGEAANGPEDETIATNLRWA